MRHNCRQLVIFDIDGTLTETAEVDAECYVRALTELFGFASVNTDWSGYPHVTDSGVLHELFRARKGRPPQPEEETAFQKRFAEHIRAAADEKPFKPLPGAAEFLRQLAASPNHCGALATGCWREPACLKLDSAGVDFAGMPFASADDAMAREDILRVAIQRAAQQNGGEEFAGMVYVGDGIWDARTCRALGLPFIGIARGSRAHLLRAEGAAWVCADFSDPDLWLEQLAAIGLSA